MMPMKFAQRFKRKKPSAAAQPPMTLPALSLTAPSPEPAQAADAPSAAGIEQEVIEVLRTVYDPEIPVNIYEMGLIYDIDVDAAGRVMVRMTLTSPGCPVAGSLMPEVELKIAAVPGVTDVNVELVWDPPWDPSRMTDAARLQLGMF
jgi:FeS assembly SUF system protein